MWLLRERGLPAAAVVAEDRVVGIVGEEELIRHAAPAWMPADPDQVRTTPVGALMRPANITLSSEEPLRRAVEIFTESNVSVLPVVDEQGRYLGLATRSDVVTGLFAAATPRSVGGLATPLGVYLTTGALRAGPGDLGLVLAGAALTIIYISARFLVNLSAWAVELKFPELPLLSVRLGYDGIYLPRLLPWYTVAWSAMFLLDFALMFVILRLSPMSAIHAAEHMVVHAIERGDDLTVEKVERMPRVHPRCGTNLTALALILVAGIQVVWVLMQTLHVGVTNTAAFVIVGTGLILGVAARRKLGAFLQSAATTRQPPRWLVAHAIKVGQRLLTRYQRNPAVARWGVVKIWNMGLLQAAAGFIGTALLVVLISRRLDLGLLP
jgi:hypothetical protein